MTAKPVCENGMVKTLCRMCDTRCSIDVHMQDGAMTDITPSEGNPVNQGRMCPRGKAGLDMFYHPDRILAPLKRQANGEFIEITRDQALDEIAEKLMRIKDRFGARSVGMWKGEGIGFQQQEEYVRRFAHAFGTPNYFSNDSACFNSRYLGHYLVAGFWNPFPDYTTAGVIFLFGTNPPVCHPPFMAEFADARASGSNLVVVDPRMNPIACYADIFAQPIPGTDGALAWGLIHQLIRTGGYDQDFVARYCIGMEKIVAYAESFTPQVVETMTGVYADVVIQMAELINKHRPKVSLYVGAGLEHHENGVNNIRALAILSCLCGALDIACGFGWPETLDRHSLTLYDELPLEKEKPIGADLFPVLYDIRKECHTMTAMDYMLGRGQYPLKGLIITAANPAVTNPNTRKVEEAFSSLDLLVVNDLFMTRTARLAHYILPAASYLERSEIHINHKFQRVYLTTRVAEIPGVYDEYRLWKDLAWRLGFGERYFSWEDETAVNRYILEPSGISLEALQAHPEGIQYKPHRYQKYRFQPLPTPSGKVEFASSYLKNLGLTEIPEYVPPYHQRHKNRDYPLLLTTGARMTLFYHSRHQNIDRFRKVHPNAFVEIHPDDATDLGIMDREQVRIVSETGSLVIEARIVHRAELRLGVIEVYHGWEDWRINFVTFDHINDPISGFPLLKAVPVRIEKI
ncbi:MAG: molybdopterin-dependent oxidoreductase [Desulfatirhabdiaceae bacterium]